MIGTYLQPEEDISKSRPCLGIRICTLACEVNIGLGGILGEVGKARVDHKYFLQSIVDVRTHVPANVNMNVLEEDEPEFLLGTMGSPS